MRRLMLIGPLLILGLLATGCSRSESGSGTSRLVSPSMTGAGMDGGVEPGEPASYLQHLP